MKKQKDTAKKGRYKKAAGIYLIFLVIIALGFGGVYL